MFPVAEYREILDRFHQLMSETEAISSVRLSGSRWTLKEMIGHLIDSASNNHQRFIRLQTEKTLHFPAYEAQIWVDASAVDSFDCAALRALWKGYNLYLLHIIEHAAPASLEHIWEIDGKSITLKGLIEDYFRHILIHEKLYRERAAEIMAAEG